MSNFKALYQSGVIGAWYLRPSQLLFLEMLRQHKFVVGRAHRRFGKGTTLLTYIAEECIRRKIIVRYIAETQLQAYQIFAFLMDKIFSHYPLMKPRLVRGRYVFDVTGSEVFIGGVKDSGEIDKLRGVESDIILCDEYAFWKFKAEYILKSVLTPQLLETNGQMIIVSTPPEDLTHNFVTQVVRAEERGNLFSWTIMDSFNAGEKTEKEVQEIIDDCGGIDSVHFQREYMCNLVPTKERLVIPEAQNDELYMGQTERPTHFDYYVCMDLGLIDHTAVLFGYLDFKNARLIVETEYCTNYAATSEIVEQCRKIETGLSIDTVYRRIGDTEMQQLFDMSKDHDYQITPITKRSRQSGKGFRDSVINQLRMGIQDGKVLVNPDCTNLVRQLKYGIWNDRRTDFERTEALGHLDALMALCYLYDNIDWNKNPYPSKWSHLKQSEAHINIEELRERDRQLQSFKKMVGR